MAYRVRKGDVKDGHVIISAYYNGLPVTEIGAYQDGPTFNAFGGTDITSVEIPDTVTYIGSAAFQACESLTSLTIPAGVKEFGWAVFNLCPNLKITVAAGNLIYSSENGILYNKAKTELIQAGGAISGSVTIPNSLTSIGDFAFDGCQNLTSINIPSNVTYIGAMAFQSCDSLVSITIPSSVTSVGDRVFGYWTASQTINVQGKADRAATIIAGWHSSWDDSCNAKIVYQP
jgi:hypothetical protein